MKQVKLVAVLKTELANLESELLALQTFAPSHDLVDALKMRIEATELMIVRASHNIPEHSNADLTPSAKDLQQQELLEDQKLLSESLAFALSINKVSKREVYSYINNMLKLRGSEIESEKIKAYLEVIGYKVVNWSDVMYRAMKDHPTIVRVKNGVFRYDASKEKPVVGSLLMTDQPIA